MSSVTDFADRFNLFLYRQHIRRLSAAEVELARDWCLTMIRKEHPKFTEDEVVEFYNNLINVKVSFVDEWTQRMT